MILQIVFFNVLYTSVSGQVDNANVVVLGVTISSCERVGQNIQFVDGIPIFHSNEHQELNIFGINITPDLQIGYTTDINCTNISNINVHVEEDTNNHVAMMTFKTPKPSGGLFSQTRYYICTQYIKDNWELLDPGSMGFYVDTDFFPPLILIIIMLLAYALSSLMSGLNIGLLALDPDELELLKEAGTSREKKYAKIILPVRRSGSYLLCSILITATLCNAISTVTINEFVSDWITVLITTCVIVLLCEIIPQAICTTYPLVVGAKTIYLTKSCMLLTAPVSYPLGKLLDWLLGKESLLTAYNKERLQELLTLTQLESHEAKIIAGTLNLSLKTVEEIMTLSNDMFKLPITAVMDFETIAMILASGYSRIPIFVDSSYNIQYILLTKDLALLDPDDKVPVKVLVQNEKLKCHYISKGTKVDRLLEIFKDSRNHMVFVLEKRDNTTEDMSSLEDASSHETRSTVLDEKNVIGLVTFEDVIEEILQMEINDETDNFTDNRSRNIIKMSSGHDLAKILKKASKAPKPSANLRLAIFNFLSEINVFSNIFLSPKVLRSLLNLDIYYTAIGQRLPQDKIYMEGVPADYFVMILEGEMEVKIGSEGLTFQAGAFRYFGLEALRIEQTAPAFVPDYMLQAVRRTTYLKISKVMYEAAILATQYDRSKKTPDISVNSDLHKHYQQIVDLL